MEARGQIKQLTIGIGIDADSLNPQEQTTTLIQNMPVTPTEMFFPTNITMK